MFRSKTVSVSNEDIIEEYDDGPTINTSPIPWCCQTEYFYSCGADEIISSEEDDEMPCECCGKPTKERLTRRVV